MAAFWIFFCLSALPAAHPIHLTLTDMAYSEKEKSLQVIHKIFVDDLELQMEQMEKERGREIRLQLNTPKEHPDAGKYLQAYVNALFQVKVNGKALSGNLIGKEYEGGAAWIYVEFTQVPRPKQIEIRDEFLMSLYDDQNNLINLEVGDKKGSLRFRKGYVSDRVEF